MKVLSKLSYFILSLSLIANLYGMTYQDYVKSDYNYIKQQAKHNNCYKRIMKNLRLKTVLQQKNKIKAFCTGKRKGKYIKYDNESWYAYIFYNGPKSCKTGRLWFFPKIDCEKVNF